MKPPINLLNYFVAEFSIKANAVYKDDQKPFVLGDGFSADYTKYKSEVEGVDHDDIWQLTLNISYKPKSDINYPYSFCITIVGFFELFPKFEEDKKMKILTVSGSSILYGTAREIVRANTSRGPWLEILLPTYSFFEKQDKKIEKKTVTKRKKTQSKSS